MRGYPSYVILELVPKSYYCGSSQMGKSFPVYPISLSLFFMWHGLCTCWSSWLNRKILFTWLWSFCSLRMKTFLFLSMAMFKVKNVLAWRCYCCFILKFRWVLFEFRQGQCEVFICKSFVKRYGFVSCFRITFPTGNVRLRLTHFFRGVF